MATLALLLAGCFGEDLPEVETARVAGAEVSETVVAPARVDAAARQDVAAAVTGVVVGVEVDDGGDVEAGQVVVRLDSTQVDLALEQAAAARQATQTAGIRVDGTGSATLASVQAAVADLDTTVAPRVDDAREHAAAVPDEAQRAAALAAVDAVEVSYLTTRAGLLAVGEALARQQDATAQSLSRALDDAVAQATAAQRAQAAAAAAAAEAQADELVVTAPFAGTVQLGEAAAAGGLAAGLPSDLAPEAAALAAPLAGLDAADGGGTLRVGAPVVAGQTLFTVFDRSANYVNADIDEVDAPAVSVGQRADVFVDAFAELTFEGVVESLRVEAATTEAGGIGYPARIRLLDAPADDADVAEALAGLRIGMTASAEIVTRTVDAELTVPSRALLRRDGETVVFAVTDSRVRLVPVRLVALGEEQAAVEGDLEPGDRVVVAGYESLVAGDEVEVR